MMPTKPRSCGPKHSGRRVAELALLGCVAAWPAALLGGDQFPGERFRAKSLTYAYDEGTIVAMPGKKIPLSVSAPARRLHRVEAPQGALTANKWTWEAPAKAGIYPLKVKNPEGQTVADFAAFVMVRPDISPRAFRARRHAPMESALVVTLPRP